MRKEYWEVTDEQLIEKTNKDSKEWIKILEEFRAKEKMLNEVVNFLLTEFNIGRYWARTILTLYKIKS
ncbi:MAG: hypothetical protein ACOYO1_13830 [Bacteroidales bacterium]